MTKMNIINTFVDNSTQLNSTQLNSTDLNFLKNKIFIKFLSVLFGYIILDNLSKRNLRLVINNFKFKEDIRMKNIKNKKNFTLLIVAVLILGLSLSCKSNEEPAPEKKSQPYIMEFGCILMILTLQLLI